MYRSFDAFSSVLLIFFFLGYLNIHAEIISLHGSPVPVSKEVEEFWDVLGWIVIGVLAFDIYLKYRKVSDPKEFVKKHWLDILMLLLMPIFAGLKLAKISVKLIKSLKLAKSGYKAAKGAKKLASKK